MLTAQEARNRSENSSQSQLKIELQEISKIIEKAAEKGNQEIIIERQHTSQEEQQLNKKIMRALHNNGYTIRYQKWVLISKEFINIQIKW